MTADVDLQRMTKAKLIERVLQADTHDKALAAEVVRLKDEIHALKTAVNGRYVTSGGRRFIALPLTDAEVEAVMKTAADACCRMCGEGSLVRSGPDKHDLDGCVYDLTLDEGDLNYLDGTLPPWQGLLVRYSYSRTDGTSVEGVWGLRRVD